MRIDENISQYDFDKLLIDTIIPELIDEYGKIDYIILDKKYFMFGKECDVCEDIILLGDHIKYPNFMKDIDIKKYFDSLLEFEVLEFEDTIICECDSNLEETFEELEDQYLNDENLNSEEDEDDYEDYEDEYYD